MARDRPRILFSSAFKPFGEADTLYSRVDSKIELFHNQITKYQGVFSPRIEYNTFGLHTIANNIEAPSLVLDFPTLDRFIQEVKKGYEYVGIGAIIPNFNKVKRMVEEVRRCSPGTKIIIGGFCAMIENVEKVLEVDYVCRGEGISFMRELLGESPEFQFRQPLVYGKTRWTLGVPFFWGDYRPCIIASLGCPYGCDFCSPSHFFGKRHIKFLKTGQEIFDEIVRLGKIYKTDSFGILGDDNFLVDEERAEELREIMVDSGLQVNLFIFASADLVAKWEPEKLAEMGIYNIWIGRESKFAPYLKNQGINMKELINDLRKVGIKVILSSILLFDFHNKANIWEDIEDHLACEPAFSQFAFYSPVSGTPFYERLKEEGRLLLNIPLEEWHAFKQPWFIHPEFSLWEAEKVQEKAYLEDFYRLGPSVVRMIRDELIGYLNMRNSQNVRLRKRAEFLAKGFPVYRAVLKGCLYLARTKEQKEFIKRVIAELEQVIGKTKVWEEIGGLGLYGFGRAWELRTRFFSDAVQPGTKISYYSGDRKD